MVGRADFGSPIELGAYAVGLVGGVNWLFVSAAEVNLVAELGVAFGGVAYMVIGLVSLLALADALDLIELADVEMGGSS